MKAAIQLLKEELRSDSDNSYLIYFVHQQFMNHSYTWACALLLYRCITIFKNKVEIIGDGMGINNE